MKKQILILCALVVSSCAMPHYISKPDPTFTAPTDVKVRLSCDPRTTSNSGPKFAQLVAFIETRGTEQIDITLDNFSLRDSGGKEYPAKLWQFSNMDALGLNLRSFNLSPKVPERDQLKTFIGPNQAVLFVLEFPRPVGKDFYFQFKGNDKKVAFSALCEAPTVVNDEFMKSLNAVPAKK